MDIHLIVAIGAAAAAGVGCGFFYMQARRARQQHDALQTRLKAALEAQAAAMEKLADERRKRAASETARLSAEHRNKATAAKLERAEQKVSKNEELIAALKAMDEKPSVALDAIWADTQAFSTS